MIVSFHDMELNRVRLSVVQNPFKQHLQLKQRRQSYLQSVLCSKKMKKYYCTVKVLRAMDKRLNRMSGPTTGIILFNAIIFCYPDSGLGFYTEVFTVSSNRYVISNYEGKNKQWSENGAIRKKFPKRIVSRVSSYFPNRWPLSYPNLTKKYENVNKELTAQNFITKT